MKRRIVAALLTVSMMACIMCAGCGGDTSSDSNNPSDETEKLSEDSQSNKSMSDDTASSSGETFGLDVDAKYLNGEGLTYGLILTTLDNPVYVAMKDEIERICEETGMELVMQTAGDAAAKVTAIESCVEAGCDMIVYMADAATEGDDAVAAAKEKGVTVGSVGARVNGTDRGFGPDNYNLGYMKGTVCGEWITETFGEEEEVEVGLLTYTPAEFVLEQDKGMRKGLADAAPNAVIVAEDNVYTPPTGMESTENFLQASPDIKAIMGFCDSCAMGAYQAFQMNGIDDDQHAVFGSDGIDEALAAIAEGGSYRATIYNSGGADMGFKMATQLLMIHNGYEFDDEGMEYWPNIVVDQENIDEYRK